MLNTFTLVCSSEFESGCLHLVQKKKKVLLQLSLMVDAAQDQLGASSPARAKYLVSE